MTNAQKFRETFGIYATEMWAMSEQDFLKWLNADTPQTDEEIRAMFHKAIDNSAIAEDAYPDLRQRLHKAVDDVPQTDCAWK